MKKNVKNIIGTVFTFLLTFFLLQYMGHRLDPLWTEGAFEAINAFHSLPANSCEVIVYGSSHAWKGCDTRVMHDNYGLEAYNYGCNWQAINTTLLFIQDSLRTQTPKVICVETFNCNGVEQDTDMDGQIYYTKAIKNFNGKRKYLKQCFGDDIERYASYYFPIMMFHDNWNTITSENYYKQDVEGALRLRGYRLNNNVYVGAIPDYTEFAQNELSDTAIDVLEEIVNSCKEKNIKIIFYTCPWEGENNYSDAMQRFCDKHGCIYLDLFKHCEEMNLSGETDLQDAGHLNSSGAAKVADYLGKYIIENYKIKSN